MPEKLQESNELSARDRNSRFGVPNGYKRDARAFWIANGSLPYERSLIFDAGASTAPLPAPPSSVSPPLGLHSLLRELLIEYMSCQMHRVHCKWATLRKN